MVSSSSKCLPPSSSGLSRDDALWLEDPVGSKKDSRNESLPLKDRAEPVMSPITGCAITKNFVQLAAQSSVGSRFMHYAWSIPGSTTAGDLLRKAN